MRGKRFTTCPKCGKRLFYLSTGYVSAWVQKARGPGQVWVCRKCRHTEHRKE